jgi:hypothetical protein
MANVAQRFEADRAKYPGMLVDEILVWKAYLAGAQQNYDSFQYNVRIGNGIDPGEAFPENTRQMAVQLTQLRIDAVGWQGDQPTLFEVKRKAYPPAVGQIMTYDAMWRAQRVSVAAPILTIVCADFAQNILPVTREANIQLAVVPVSFSVLASPDPRT